MFSEGVQQSHQDLLAYPLVLETRDAEEAASMLADSAVPYRSQPLGPRADFSTQIFGAQSPRMHWSRVKTTGAMKVEAQLPDDSYAVVLSVAGEVEHRVAGETVGVGSGWGLVQSPLQPVEAWTPGRFELLFLKLSRENLVQELEKMLLRQINSPLVFFPCFNLRTEAGQRFRRLVLSLCTHLGRMLAAGSNTGGDSCREQEKQYGLGARVLENDLVSLLLEAQRHNYTRLLVRSRHAGPWQVRAAEEYMSANAHLALSLGDVSMAAGVSSRTLQYSFQRKRRYTPMQFLRRLRLERVHEDLAQPNQVTTVTKVASRWGFLHFGRFAAEYQARFGEKPSETLQRSRKQQ
jgi:AraC-like DNA-binding protein